MGQLDIGGYSFKGVCRIIPELDETGKPREYSPQDGYLNIKNLKLNEFGKGPFCRFRVPTGIFKTGVYVVKVTNEIKYVGECKRLPLVGIWGMVTSLRETATSVDNQQTAS